MACVFFCLERKWDRMAQVFRVERNKNFTVMCNPHFKNKNLSLKAKGLLSLMLSLPEDWNYNMQGLATLSRDGIDHGYGNMKTATRCFPSGVARYDKEPIFQNNLLFYNGMYYQIGEEHKEFCAEKTQDEDGAMVITQNPTFAPAVQKSKYEPKALEADISVSSDTVKDATAFLKTFFKLYPTVTEKELAYYVKDGVLAPVSGDYVFSELVNPVFTKDGDNLKVSVSVKYLDNKSKMTQISQYELMLHKDDNWKIVG